jgi:hypothetical protein
MMSAKSASASSATSTSSGAVVSLRSEIRSCMPVPMNRSREIDIASLGIPLAVPFRR